ncbi:DUF192 domain-containing protein [Sphingomonas sp. TX0543]|uniref:DUF192 domain-containing protein n=1 Tax=unclassified Sphingomonas TaxID=196159 RepID=UPI0010F73C85|nr:DUF192 domain-containing protein [Sphingomonas sp. 3P27F8]
MFRILAVAMIALLAPGCSPGSAGAAGEGNAAGAVDADGVRQVALTIAGPKGAHGFRVEVAATAAQQERGLMFRTDIPKDGGMLFAPYPPDGGAPKIANFWMKNTPSSLDILFIRPDHTIARIAENTVPFSETPIPSGEPVVAVLELNGGRAGELGIDEGDKVTWGR